MDVTVKVSFVDKHGTLLTDVLPDAPIVLDESDLTENGNYLENKSKLNFGRAQRDVVIESMIMTTGPGFFENCPECEFENGGVDVQKGTDVVVNAGDFEVEKPLV